MATKKRKYTKRKTQKQTKQNQAAQRQLYSVIGFAVAIFLLCVVFIKGENVWLWLHNFVFGLFGVTAYAVPFFVGIVSVFVSMEKLTNTTIAKLVEGGVLIAFIGAAIDIFSKHTDISFWLHLGKAYTNGIALKSGGFVGALIGQPIYLLFGKTGAAITVILLMFVLLMILTGTTLISLFKMLKKPAKAVAEQAQSAYQKNDDKDIKVVKGFNVDVPVDGSIKERQKEQNELPLKSKRLIRAYKDESEPEANNAAIIVQPEGAEDKAEMDTALQAAKVEDEKIVIDMKAETEIFTEEVKENLESATDRGYVYPPTTLLKETRGTSALIAEDNSDTAEHLVRTLRSFGVETRIVDISRGPTVTRYELQPCAGVKISKITALADDIALNLAAGNVRIEAPIPNKAAVGIEVPNKEKRAVGIREILEAPEFTSAKSKLTVALGKDITGNIITTDIAKMPHGLIAGATGSGKSVCTNSIIISLLYKNTPDELKLLLIDPKTVEFEPYNGIPHLMVPVVTDPRKAAGALGWAVGEMEKRYKMLSDRKVRNIEEYNEAVEGLVDEPEVEKMPYIVIMIDEFADLMQTASKEVEDHIARLAAKARAAGIHMILATQRPSVDVITGVIKANIPTRIALTTSSQIDSRTIIDQAGAEKLLGRGDMLFNPVGTSKPSRLQGCFVSNEEIKAVVDFVKGDRAAAYNEDVMNEIERQAAIEKKQRTGVEEDGPDEDPMLKDAIRVVVENGLASTSLLQRKLKLGYARAARIIDEMEQRGIVGGYEGSKPRKVLITSEQLMEMEAAGKDEV
ncbi:MAG: DNA translocase FtsK 4TM domain-containing protein [Clostridia bacterium]|nr:DNA translocase FtsK 4TM domain-containing protein [Clostridia bacterium]